MLTKERSKKKVEVLVTRPFKLVTRVDDDVRSRIVKIGEKVQLDESLAAEMVSANKATRDLTAKVDIEKKADKK